MKLDDIKRQFAMPLVSPSYSPSPYRFRDREFLIISYRTDPNESYSLLYTTSKFCGLSIMFYTLFYNSD